MRRPRLVTAVGDTLILYSAAFLVPVAVSLVLDAEVARTAVPWVNVRVKHTTAAFLMVALSTLVLGRSMVHIGRRERMGLRSHEAVAALGIGSIILAVLGSVPFLLSLAIPSPLEALFEGMSGLTTTGSTILVAPYAQYPESVLVWRSLLEWVGGFAFIVLSVTVIGRLTLGHHRLMVTATAEGSVTRSRPQVASTVKTLSGLYAAATLLTWLAYAPIMRRTEAAPTWGQAVFDGLLHALSTVSTGGFSNHARSIAAYDSGLLRTVMTVFMVLAGVSFALTYAVVQSRSLRPAWRSQEFRFYLGLFFAASLAVAVVFRFHGGGFLDNLSHGTFHTASFLTGTGYTSVTPSVLPDAAVLVFLLLMFTGGMFGSTTGGIKSLRILLLLKLTRREFQKLLHPHAVSTVKYEGRILESDVLHRVVGFFFAYVGLFIAGAAVHVTLGLDMVAGLSASASALGNVGPAFGGLDQGYASLHPLSKATHIVLMWLGRLEIFAALVLFVPAAYRDRGPG